MDIRCIVLLMGRLRSIDLFWDLLDVVNVICRYVILGIGIECIPIFEFQVLLTIAMLVSIPPNAVSNSPIILHLCPSASN